MLGPSRVGKSLLGNLLLGWQAFDTLGGRGTAEARGVACGRRLLVVDTPGWQSWKDKYEENEAKRSRGVEVSKSEKLELLSALNLCDPGPHALLLVLPLLPFSQQESAALLARMEIFTPGVWSHSMVVFTLGDKLEPEQGRTFEQYLEGAGEQLQQLLGKCCYRCHVLNNKAPEDRSQVNRFLEKVEDRVMENCGWHFSLVMYCRLEEEWTRRERDAKERWEREQQGRHHGAPQDDMWLRMDIVSHHLGRRQPKSPKLTPVCQG